MDDKTVTTRAASLAHLGRHATNGARIATESRSCLGELDLDLLDVMLDLDPGALVWSSRHGQITTSHCPS